jgi:hypothetical protein
MLPITPKLLLDLKYHERMKVLYVNNGKWLPEEIHAGNMTGLIEYKHRLVILVLPRFPDAIAAILSDMQTTEPDWAIDVESPSPSEPIAQ